MDRDQSAREIYLIYKSFTENWEIRFPENPTAYLSKGTVMTKLGEIEEGFKIGKKGIDLDTSNHFNIARFLAVQDRKDEALDHLELALEQGYRQITWIKMEPDISLLKEEKRYKDLMDEYFNLN
jgi:tetratricopeptide (TPR) repeat protein